MKNIILICACIFSACLIIQLFAETKSLPEAQQLNAEQIELSGIMHRPVKWTPLLKLDGNSKITYFDIQGKLLDGIEEGKHIRVKGIVKSKFHKGGTQENPSPFPVQWIIWLEVTEIEIMDDGQQTPTNKVSF